MNLVNATRMLAAYNLGLDPDGRERVVAIIKGTFHIPESGKEPTLAELQVPLVEADEFYGEPGFSAVKHESDYVPFKPRCDVLLNGSAYAPGGVAATAVSVRLRIGAIDKSFEVFGNRIWSGDRFGVYPSNPESFEKQEIHYGRAFGGFDVAPQDPRRTETFPANPVGVGYLPISQGLEAAGKPVPNTQERHSPITNPQDRYRPMSFGPIGRNFGERVPYAGTYDDRWTRDVCPMLPGDFNPLYYQCAPADQQIDYPKGGDLVELFNLTPAGYTAFRLPQTDLPVEFTDADYHRNEIPSVVDTVFLEPDFNRFTMCWRASQPLKRNLLEIRQIVVGRMSRGWYRARALGKTYYPSLSSAIKANENGLVEISE